MACQAFGYETSDGRFRRTTKELSPELKGYIDSTLLEGKIGDTFDRCEGCQKLVDRIEAAASKHGDK